MMTNEMYLVLGVSLGLVVLILAIMIGIIVALHRKRKRFVTERMERVQEILYTEIISSGFVGYPGKMTVNACMTKFLVVYKNGEKELVDVADDSEICKIYLGFVKVKEEK